MARPVFLVFVYKKGYRWNSPASLLNVFPEPFTPSPTCAGDRKVPRLCTTHCLVFWSVIFGIWILSTSLALLVHLYIRYLGSDITFFLEAVKALLPVSQTSRGHWQHSSRKFGTSCLLEDLWIFTCIQQLLLFPLRMSSTTILTLHFRMKSSTSVYLAALKIDAWDSGKRRKLHVPPLMCVWERTTNRSCLE